MLEWAYSGHIVEHISKRHYGSAYSGAYSHYMGHIVKIYVSLYGAYSDAYSHYMVRIIVHIVTI